MLNCIINAIANRKFIIFKIKAGLHLFYLFTQFAYCIS